MITVAKLAAFAVGSLLTQSCLAADPVLVQTDIVFPRNNTVYKPVYPFPIVFALNNFSNAWEHKPVVNWRLLAKQSSGDWAMSEEGSMGWTNTSPKEIASGPLLGINASQYIIQENASSYALQYEFRIGTKSSNRCTGPGFLSETSGSVSSTAAFFTGRIFFNTSNTTGILPDIEGSGTCGTPLGAVGYSGPNETEPICPLLSWPRPDPKPCAYSIDAKSAGQVAQAMTNQSFCKGMKWPSFTRDCPTTKSDGRRLDWNSVALFSILFGLSFVLL